MKIFYLSLPFNFSRASLLTINTHVTHDDCAPLVHAYNPIWHVCTHLCWAGRQRLVLCASLGVLWGAAVTHGTHWGGGWGGVSYWRRLQALTSACADGRRPDYACDYACAPDPAFLCPRSPLGRTATATAFKTMSFIAGALHSIRSDSPPHACTP